MDAGTFVELILYLCALTDLWLYVVDSVWFLNERLRNQLTQFTIKKIIGLMPPVRVAKRNWTIKQ